MKVILLILFLLPVVHAKANKLMLCLGQEELRLHKNERINQHYKLNQDVISTMVQLQKGVILNPKYYKLVCNEKVIYPSFELLKNTIIHKEKTFINTLDPDSIVYSIAQKSINEQYQLMVKVFIDYLGFIRAQTQDKDCIVNHIPQLKPFYEKMLFLQEDMDIEKIIDSISDIQGVFIKLEYVDSILKKCNSKKQ